MFSKYDVYTSVQSVDDYRLLIPVLKDCLDESIS